MILLAGGRAWSGTPAPALAAHALLAPLAAEHVAAIRPELGEQRLRAGMMRLACLASMPLTSGIPL